MDKLTALLDFYSVVCALVIATRGLVPLRKGNSQSDQRKNEEAKGWNKVWSWAYYAAFATAALSFFIKIVLM